MRRRGSALPHLLLASVALLMAPAQGVFGAGDPEAGRAKANSCSGCHGPDGMSPNDLWPNLAGQQRRYLAKQLRDFRDGKRHDPIMSTFARGLTDEDIADLAAWYSSLEPRVAARPDRRTNGESS